MKPKSWGLELKFKAASTIKEVKILEVYKELTRITVKLWRAELKFFFSSMLTERKDVKCSCEGGIWLVRYKRESWYFFNVFLQQNRRRVCGTLQNWTIAGEHHENQKAKHRLCRLPKADIMWTEYLSRVRKRERSGHMRDNRKDFFVEMLLMYNGEDLFPQNEMWKQSQIIHERESSGRKGKSKGKISLWQKKYRRLLE